MNRFLLPALACLGGITGWTGAGWFLTKPPKQAAPKVERTSLLAHLTGGSARATPSLSLPATIVDRQIALEQLAHRDPQRALEATLAAVGSDSRQQRFQDLSTIFRIWADQDRKSAIRAFLNSRRAFELRDHEKGTIFQALASQAPDETLTIL